MKKEYFDASALLQDVFGTDRPVPMLDPQTNYVSDKIGELDDDIVDTIIAYYDAEEPDSPKPTKEVKYTKEQLLETLRHHLSEDICLLSMKSHDAIISGYIRQHEEIAKLRAQLAEKASESPKATPVVEDDTVTEQSESPATKAYNFTMESLFYYEKGYIVNQAKAAIEKAYKKAQAEEMDYLETIKLFRKSLEPLENCPEKERFYSRIDRYVKRYEYLSQYKTIDANWLYQLERTTFHHPEDIEKITGFDCRQYFHRLGLYARIPHYIGEIIVYYLKNGDFMSCINIGKKRSDNICAFINRVFTEEQLSELRFREYSYEYARC